MSRYLKLLGPVGMAASIAYLGAQTSPSQDQPKPGAREMFYMGSGVHKVGSKSTGTKKPTGGSGNSGGSAASGTSASGGASAADAEVQNAVDHGGAQVIQASLSAPVGVSYSILQVHGKNRTLVSPDTVFRAEDQIQFDVSSNYDGYLYIGFRKPNGKWKSLFPDPNKTTENRVLALQPTHLPHGYGITMKDPAQTEHIFVLFSRDRVADFDDYLRSSHDQMQPAPKGGGKSGTPPPLVAASDDLPPTLVDRLRQAYTRDLVLEPVEDEVYAVSKKMDDRSLWIEFQLVHK